MMNFYSSFSLKSDISCSEPHIFPGSLFSIDFTLYVKKGAL